METWKAMLAVAGMLVLFGVLASVLNVSLSSPRGFALLIGAIVGSVLFFVISRYGYRLGRNMGERMQDEE